MVCLVEKRQGFLLNMLRLQSGANNLQAGFSLCRTAFSVVSKVDWSGHLDSNSDGGVVHSRLGSILLEREDFILDMSSAPRHAAGWFYPRGKFLYTLQLEAY